MGAESLVLHIGLPKTGTTFLQNEIFPRIRSANVIVGTGFLRNFHIENGKLNIISYENFSVAAPHTVRKVRCSRIEVLDHLHNLFPYAKIIVGVRNREAWLKSCYNSYVSSARGVLSLDEYLDFYRDDVLDMDCYIKEVKARWSNVFVYHQDSLNDEIDAMCSFIGCETPVFDRMKRLNSSFPDDVLRSMRRINGSHWFLHFLYMTLQLFKELLKERKSVKLGDIYV